MLAISLDTAKNIAVAIAVIFVGGAVASAWLMKTIVQKLMVMGVLVLLAFLVWTQRIAMQDCADAVRDSFELAGSDVVVTDTTCSFFGIDVTISDPRTS